MTYASPASQASKPHLRVSCGRYVVHGDKATRVTFAKGKISVGCADADPEALRKLLFDYDAWNATNSYVHQDGC